MSGVCGYGSVGVRALTFVALIFALTCAVVVAETKADFFVATNGNDAWSGRLSAPNPARTDGPFATVDRARLAVRNARRADRPISVSILGGTYYLTRTLTFEPEDSGTKDAPVVYSAYPGERPIISGGKRLTGWKVDSRGWWHLTIPEVKSGEWNFISLYVNGERRYRPRLPESGSYTVANSVSLGPNGKPNGFEFATDEIKGGWANLNDVEALTIHLWNMSRMRVQTVDAQSHQVRFTGETSQNADFAQFNPGQPFMVENVKESLGKPGEWYLDRPTGELIYVPKKGETPEKCEVIAPRVDQLVRLNGDWRTGRFVSDITFKGLTFAHSQWCTPPEGHQFPQSDAVVASAIIANGSRNCRFDACTITHTGAYGIQLDDACKFNTIENCELTDLGAGGIKVGFWAPTDGDGQTGYNIIRGNLIAHGGRIFAAGTGILVASSDHNRIEKNDIYDLYYTGISLGYTWADSVSAHDNLVQDNHIHDIGQGTLSDMGGIYTLGRSPGTVIRHNLIHDIRSQLYGGWGIYLDALSSEITVQDNLVYRTDEGALHHNRGQDNVVTNNIFALGSETQVCRSGYENGPSFDFQRNIVYWKDGYLLGREWSDNHFKFDHNVYWNAGRKPVEFNGLSLDEWRAKGQDAHSIIADPLFANPEKGDFRLASDSPALGMGFRPIEMAGFGRQSPSVPEESTSKSRSKSTRGAERDRAFPDLSKPVPLKLDFEGIEPGRRPPFCALDEGNQVAIRVTDEDAASGRHSLKFADDGKQQYPWQPFMTYRYKQTSGVVRASFAVKVMPGGHLKHEWRDIDKPDQPGPSVVIDSDGKLYANGKYLQTVPREKWIRLEIACRLGAKADGTYMLKVKSDDTRTYKNLKYSQGFHRLMTLYWIADGSEPGVFYLDDIKVCADERS